MWQAEGFGDALLNVPGQIQTRRRIIGIAMVPRGRVVQLWVGGEVVVKRNEKIDPVSIGDFTAFRYADEGIASAGHENDSASLLQKNRADRSTPSDWRPPRGVLLARACNSAGEPVRRVPDQGQILNLSR